MVAQAWASATLRHSPAHQSAACRLSTDLIEEVCRWMPPRVELSDRGRARAISLGIIVASVATRGGANAELEPEPDPEPEPEPEPELEREPQPEPKREPEPQQNHPWTRMAATLQERFGCTHQQVWAALKAERGHAGRAAALLRATLQGSVTNKA